ncbi:MaoC family dehydratase [Paraburkholderia aspalathi]|uniref:Acyl dehydratase n=1 Tax=Paraburkholderia aspalathi TaxID=1324617 RepID=A0A1I7E9V6_9BURK|nr:MaoC family dehydratase [Paraburkholderia aspalathi]SFU20720.1 Acyl dehydratase [Paraburkholderia aspalathi]
MRNITSPADAQALVGQGVLLSSWTEIGQMRIDEFAAATGDRQWIHVDVERAGVESPFRSTVAHGFLTLSLLPYFLDSCLEFKQKMAVNYGLNKVRFITPVPSGSRVRGRIALISAEEASGTLQLVWSITVELDGSVKPACVAEMLTRHVF